MRREGDLPRLPGHRVAQATIHRLRNRTLPVLAAVVLLFIIYPVFDTPGQPTPIIGMVLFAAVPLFGVMMLATRRWMMFAAAIALAANVAVLLFHDGHTEQAIANWPGIVVLGFYVVSTGIIAHAVFVAPSVVDDRVYGGVAVYIMIGFTFAILHHRAFVQDATAYIVSVEGTGRTQLNWADFIYFSFVSLTTVGFGDIVPKSAWARNLSVMEAFIGMLYPAILLARLVNRTQAERDLQPAKSSA